MKSEVQGLKATLKKREKSQGSVDFELVMLEGVADTMYWTVKNLHNPIATQNRNTRLAKVKTTVVSRIVDKQKGKASLDLARLKTSVDEL